MGGKQVGHIFGDCRTGLGMPGLWRQRRFNRNRCTDFVWPGAASTIQDSKANSAGIGTRYRGSRATERFPLMSDMARAPRVAGVVLLAVVWSNLACHGDLHDAAKTRDIYSAARYGDVRRAQALLKDNPDLAFSKDLNGWTALHWAAANRQLAVAELLLACHADANARSASRTTPLHEAAGAGDKEVAELLLTHRADINARDKSGGTPLHWAVLTDRRGVAELLLARHAAVNAKTALGYTPLQMAASMGHEEMAELLLANNALVNTIANDGSTPLHTAVVAGNKRIAELLRQHGGRE